MVKRVKESNRSFSRKWKTSVKYTSRGFSLNDPMGTYLLFSKEINSFERIVFLDIDDVLNHKFTKWVYIDQTMGCAKFKGIDRELVQLLNELIDYYPDIRFVLSSSWRTIYLDTIYYLKYQGFKGHFIGKTKLPDENRGLEILEFIEKTGYKNKWIALDDDDSCSILGGNWIQTEVGEGMFPEHIKAAIEALK